MARCIVISLTVLGWLAALALAVGGAAVWVATRCWAPEDKLRSAAVLVREAAHSVPDGHGLRLRLLDDAGVLEVQASAVESMRGDA